MMLEQEDLTSYPTVFTLNIFSPTKKRPEQGQYDSASSSIIEICYRAKTTALIIHTAVLII
jgi:hypothetical protein